MVARCGAGLDNVDTRAAAAAGVAVVHAPGLTTSAVAEHALMLMLALSRRVVEVDGAVKAGRWNVRDGFESTELRGKRMGVIGLGAIGTKLADFGRMLDMDVVCATRRQPDADVERVGLDELLATSDVVQLCVPLTESTRSMIGEAQFSAMKPGALLVNTSRGAVVDHVALADALARNSLGGYATDVWDPEPPQCRRSAVVRRPCARDAPRRGIDRCDVPGDLRTSSRSGQRDPHRHCAGSEMGVSSKVTRTSPQPHS